MAHRSQQFRYRICFQTKNKVWIYKNSRLRNFYLVRNKIVLPTGKIAKQFLVTKNMKWTVARRAMVPYLKTKSKFYFFYKNLFFTKQQLKMFHGGLKEYQIRNIFKNTWNKEHSYRTNIFIGALEQRLAMVLFRMRLLPTIFACNQFIKHQGVLVNNEIITLTNYRIKIGDILSLSEKHWLIFYQFLYERLKNRFFGQSILVWRKQFLLKKIHYYRLRNKNFYIFNFKLLQKFLIQKKQFLFLKKYIKHLYLTNQKQSDKENFINILKITNIFLYKYIFKKLKKIQNTIHLLHRWSKSNYHLIVNFILFNIYNINKILTKVMLLIYRALLIEISNNLINNMQKLGLTEKRIVEVQSILKKIFLKKYFIWIKKQAFVRLNLQNFLKRGLKKTLKYKNQTMRYKKYFLFLLKQLKQRKLKKKTFKRGCSKPHWYIPQYIELDYCTLRAIFLYYPESTDVVFGFLCSFKKIISFYKERAL